MECSAGMTLRRQRDEQGKENYKFNVAECLELFWGPWWSLAAGDACKVGLWSLYNDCLCRSSARCRRLCGQKMGSQRRSGWIRPRLQIRFSTIDLLRTGQRVEQRASLLLLDSLPKDFCVLALVSVPRGHAGSWCFLFTALFSLGDRPRRCSS